MKSLTLLTFLGLFLYMTGHMNSQELPFEAERLGTDYNGTLIHNNTVLCFGKYGIITYSKDYGITWKQYTIGNKYTVRKMISVKNTVIACTDSSLLQSTDDGLTWKNSVVSQGVIDILKAHDNLLFILSQTGVYTADSNLNVSTSPILALDEFGEYSEMQLFNNTLYIIADRGNIIQHNLSNGTNVTVNVIKKVFGNSCPSCTSLKTLTVFNETLFCLIQELNANKQHTYTLVKLASDSSWTKAYPYRISSRTLLFKDGFPHYIDMRITRNGTSYPVYQKPFFAAMDTSRFSIDSTIERPINLQDSSEHVLSSRSIGSSVIPFEFTALSTKGNDTLFAVGINKLIVSSFDGGKHWNLHSAFRSFTNGNIEFSSDSFGYALDKNTIFVTTNGGITWMPQKKVQAKEDALLSTSDIRGMYLNPNGSGLFIAYSETKDVHNVFTTNDFGRTYTSQYAENFFVSDNPQIFKFFKNSSGMKVGNSILFFGGQNINNNENYVLRYDANTLKHIETVTVPISMMRSIVKVHDSLIVSLGINFSGQNRFDSLGQTNYQYSYMLLQSKDEGKTWDSIPVRVPIEKPIVEVSGYKFFTEQTLQYIIPYKNLLLFPMTQGKVLTFNLQNNTFDSVFTNVNFPSYVNFGKNPFFSFNGDLIGFMQNQKVVRSLGSASSIDFSDLISAENIFGQWNNFTNMGETDKDAILQSHMFSDTIGILISGRTYLSGVTNDFALNAMRISPVTPSVVLNVNETQDIVPAYLYNSTPYPLPGNSFVQSTIYWNKDISMDNITHSVYTIHGNTVEVPKGSLTLNSNQPYSAQLRWDCTDIPAGMYIIHITLGTESRSIPVIIMH
jgi:photosystem II stability/assembly factor-like uncharacterized protein